MINRQEYEKMDYFEMLFSMYIILSKAILCNFWYYTAAYIEIEFTIFPINFAILKKYCQPWCHNDMVDWYWENSVINDK